METDLLVALTHVRDAIMLLAYMVRYAFDLGVLAAGYILIRGYL